MKAYHPGDQSLRGIVQSRDATRKTLRCEEGGVSRAIDVLRSRGTLPEATWHAILYHFICRFISRSADTGLWNVLIGPDGSPYGIEEVRCKEEKMPMTLWDVIFLRKPAKVYWPQIEKAVQSGKAGWAAKIHTRILPHLATIDKDGEMMGRALHAYATVTMDEK